MLTTPGQLHQARVPTRYAQAAPTSPAVTDQGATAELLHQLAESNGSASQDRMDRTSNTCEQDDYRAAVARAQAVRKRQADAAQWIIARVVSGSGLAIRTLEGEALITSPRRRGNGSVRIRYAGGAVYRNGAYLGILDGYEPSDGQRIGREQILAALLGDTR